MDSTNFFKKIFHFSIKMYSPKEEVCVKLFLDDNGDYETNRINKIKISYMNIIWEYKFKYDKNEIK